MSVIHFKFKNSLDYDSITFDGLHLSLKDLKKCIIQKKRLKSEEVDLNVINAQTREEYKDNEQLIPRNTSVVIARVPVNTGNTREPAVSRDKVWEAFRMTTQAAIEEHENVSHEKHHELDHGHPISEMDRIKEMMRQSTSDFDPSKYDKKYPTGPVSSTYVCFKCGQIGQHHIYLCPFRGDTTTQDNRMKRSTGIPQSFMIKVDDPNMPGAYKTNTGYAVPAIDAVAYAQGKKERPPFLPNETREEQEPAIPVPKDYLCLLCSNIMTDAAVIPCCGNSYCDDCIRNALLETEEHICPTCGEIEISPDRLIPNRFLRTAISNFYNETGTIVKTTRVPVIHAQHNGPGPQQPGVAPQGQTGPPITQIPYMQPARPTGAPVVANALPRLQMPPPSSQGPPPPQQLTPNTPTQDEVAPLVPQTTVTDEELAKGLTIKTTVGYRRPMRLDPQDLPKPRGPPPHSRSLPPRPPMRPPGPPPPRFPPPNMPPPGAMLSMPPRIIPPQVLPGPPPAVMLGPLPPVLLPPPPGPIPVFPPPPGPFPPPGVYAEKPLTREEFYRTKKMLKEAKEKKRDLIDDFAKELLGFKRDQTKRKSLSRSRSRSRSRSWSRSRSRSRPRFRSRSFSRSRSRSRTPLRRSITPRRSRSRTPRSRSQLSRSPLSRSPRPRRVSRSSSISHSRSRRSFSRSRTRSRSFSPRRSRSRSRLRSLSRGRTPVRLRSKSLSRRRSLTPTRRRSWSRSLSRSRSRTPLKRSSRSRSFSPRGRSVKRFSRSRSRTPGRRSLKRFSRSLSNSPLQKRFSRSPVGKKFSKSPNRPQSSRSPSLGKPATSSSIKKLSRSPSVTKLSRSPNSKRFSKSPGKKDLPKSPERKKLSRSPDSKRISPSISKKRVSQSPGRKIHSRSPSKKRLSRSPSKKIVSRSPSKKRLSRSPSPRRSSKSPSRRRSKSPTRKRSPLPPRKRSLSPRPRRRSRSPPYHDNFRNDWPPYRSPRSPPQQGYPPGRYTQAQLSYSYMQPGDPYYRYDQQMENYHQYYQDYYQRYGFPPPPPPGTYNRVSQYHEVSHPGPYRPNSPPRGPRTRSPFRGRAPDNRNQDKPRPERRNTDRSSERPKGDNNKKSSNKPQKAMKPGIRKETKNETDYNKVKQGTANTKEGAKKEGATKVAPKDKKKPVASKSKPGVVKVVKEKKDKTSSGKEESDTLAKVKKAPTKRVAEVKEATTKSDETEKENDKSTTKPKTEAAPESTSEIGTTGTQVRSDPPSTSEENAVNKAKKKRRLKPPLPSEVEVSQSDSNSEADKKTKPSLKRLKTELEAAVPSSSKDENENASPAKRQKTEPSPSAENEVGSSTDDKIESELEPLPVPETDQLMLDPPEISKWEKEEERFTDSSPDRKSKAAQKTALEKKALPRSVIESAEKVLSQKPMRPTLASAVSTTSIKPQPAKTGRRVFLDSEGKPEERRVSKNSIQITVSSSAEKRTVTGEEDLRNKLIRDRKLSRESREQSKGSSERSHTLSSVATPVQQEGRKPEKTHRALPRKESVMDESKFEPDYDERTSDSEEGNTDKETASSRGSDVSQSQSPSSDTSPAKKQKFDEESQDKDKKHKHRHSRHKKHKKHKHKHKKKKHKLEKEEKGHEKLKSSIATAR